MKVSLWRTAMVAAIASVVVATTALAQMPTSPWKKGAPLPEADEELYGVTVNGKLYVFGGWGEGKARGVAYEYDPATDRWTKKTPMPRPAHHVALAAANGKIYVMGGFVAPQNTAIPVGGAWEPIDNAWEYDPAGRFLEDAAAAAREARVRGRRGSRGEDLRHRRPDRARLHPVGHQHRCGGGVQPHQRLVERAEGTDADRAQKGRVGL